jgi:hypothetical protein
MTRRRRLSAALAAVALAGTGCGEEGQDLAGVREPTCSDNPTLVLMAQSVPDATLIPCVRGLPTGWDIGRLVIRDGHSRFTLDSDRAGIGAVSVLFEPGCDGSGATRIPSDEVGTTRYERVEEVFTAYRGARYYLYPGGCTTYTFRFPAPSRAIINEVSLSVSFVSRAEVAAELARRTGGVEQL